MTRSTVDRPSSTAVTARIFQLVLSLRPEERQSLLSDLETLVSERDRRRTRRSAAYISVDLESPKASGQGLIRNVSAGGLFIRTENPMDVGADVLMTFMVPESRRWVRAIGTVTRVSGDGAGIRFVSGLKSADRLDPT
ncbi:MAG: PilZ domain-containing protein [Desulfobacterales bacterium]|jgi:type IV pilus assembly protein PilZ